MNTNEVDIDRIVNYKTEYSQEIKKNKITGDELLGLCPFHQDSKPSFTVNLKNGCYECKACGEKGNYITYYAKTRGLSNKDAYKAILANYNVENNWQPESALKYTLKEYAFQKRLPEQYLADNFHITNGVERRTGKGYIKIPYYGHDQQEVTFRKRYNDPKDKFRWKTGTKINTMYGEWRLSDIQDIGYVIMVEGESDTQTLWYLNFPALGVPGASCVKPEFLDKIEGMRVYIHVEPDMGGQTFLRNMTNKLKDFGFTGQVYQMSCKTHGEKDPSNLYIKYGAEEAKKKIQGLVKNAKPIDLEHLNEIIPESVPGFSINLRLPPSWMYSEKGIHHKDEKTQEFSCVCRTPIIISKRIKSMDVGDEKVEIEFKRDGKVQSAIFPRSTIFQSKSITILSDLGCTITSENAKYVVRFLAALEAENYDIIPSVDSTSTFGWQTKGRFLPGHGDDIVLDIDNSLRSWANAYEVRGDFDKWKETMAPHRERDKFRFILASSFTAPLLKWISQRIFFIYNWGDSKGGKAQPLDTRLITPEGDKLMGDIRMGDKVIGCDGKPHTVIGIYPQGMKDVYELTFSDGTKTKCCKEHLWTVSTRTRRNHNRGYTVMELSEILKKPIKTDQGYTFRIPVCKAVEYSVNPTLKIDAYLLGLLIGDGSLSMIGGARNRLYFSNMEVDILEKLNNEILKIGGHITQNHTTKIQYEIACVNELKNNILNYGLNVKSDERFIPKDYLVASIPERKRLLAGLMDTDGTVEQNGSYRYSTVSVRLAEDVSELCRSLGYRVNVSAKSRSGKSTEYCLHIATDEVIVSSVKHKTRLAHCINRTDRLSDKTSMAIVDIKKVGREECQCIMVDSEEHTYLCDDFIVTHNTAGLKAALSAWGDPEKLMVNFNATQVALERMAGFYCDLPLGIDERQLAGNNQGSLEKIVYMIASGTGRARGSKGGGLQEMRTWRTVAIATGEEPLNTESSMTGISTRVLELYGGPFTNEKDASMMHQTAGLNCGWAGPYFIEKLLEIGSEEIKKRFEIMMAYVHEKANGENGAHTASIAAVALADSLVDQWIFGSTDQEASEERAKAMAETILKSQQQNRIEDVNENAVQFIMDWIGSNKNYFGIDVAGTCYGYEDNGYVYVFPSLISKTLTSNNYSPRKTLRYMSDNQLIETDPDGKYSIVKWFNNKATRFVKIDIHAIEEKFYRLKDDEFRQVTLEDEELPF